MERGSESEQGLLVAGVGVHRERGDMGWWSERETDGARMQMDTQIGQDTPT